MEIVLALAAIAGSSLIAVPRLRRRGHGQVRANAGKQWTASHAARRRRGSASGQASTSRLSSRTAAVATGAGSAAYASDADLDWDDDLGWGGDTAVATPERDEQVWDEPPANGAVTAEPQATNGSTPAAPVTPDQPVWNDWDEPAWEEPPRPPASPRPTTLRRRPLPSSLGPMYTPPAAPAPSGGGGGGGGGGGCEFCIG